MLKVIALQSEHSLKSNEAKIGRTFKVLIEGTSKRSEEHLFGRTTQNVVMVFPKENAKKGDYVHVLAEDCTAATLIGRIVNPEV